MKLLTVFGTGLFIIIAACSMQQKAEKQQQSLYGTKWSLKKIYTGSTAETVNTRAFIKVDKEKGSAGGNGSCNSFGSTVVVSGTSIKFSDIFSTKMYCEGVQKTEDAFFRQLAKADRYEIQGHELKLYDGKTLLLVFQAITQ